MFIPLQQKLFTEDRKKIKLYVKPLYLQFLHLEGTALISARRYSLKKLWVIVSKEKFQACVQPDFHKQEKKKKGKHFSDYFQTGKTENLY